MTQNTTNKNKIYAVGIGPGGCDDMTIRALNIIKKCEVIAGYSTYIELLGDLINGKEIIATGMRSERQRCIAAIEKAMSGKMTALISSGDSGVYGMAGLLYEITERYDNIDIEVVPGITAAVSGAALIGAPIMNDFAVVSLSDLLTSWEEIEKRLMYSAKGNFSIAIYNPSSKNRSENLKKACEILLKYKEPSTPCGIVKNISREGQKYSICTLGELSEKHADMTTTIFIGNSYTKIIGDRIVTKRGYKI